MTPCDKFQEALAPEALETAPSEDLRAHLESCPACRTEFQAYRELAQALQGLESADPGELFFAAQRNKIRAAISAPAARPARFWRPALALAAAALLLFIGLSQWQRRESPSLAWSQAMLVLSTGQGSVTGSGILELETLSPEQLEGLARNIEGRILYHQGDELLEEAVEVQDLSGPELEQLIQRLKSHPGEQA